MDPKLSRSMSFPDFAYELVQSNMETKRDCLQWSREAMVFNVMFLDKAILKAENTASLIAPGCQKSNSWNFCSQIADASLAMHAPVVATRGCRNRHSTG